MSKLLIAMKLTHNLSSCNFNEQISTSMMPDCPGAMNVNSNNYRTYSCDGGGNFDNPVDINFLSAHALWDENQRELRMSFIDIYFMLRYWYPEGRMKQDQSKIWILQKKPQRCKGKRMKYEKCVTLLGRLNQARTIRTFFFGFTCSMTIS